MFQIESLSQHFCGPRLAIFEMNFYLINFLIPPSCRPSDTVPSERLRLVKRFVLHRLHTGAWGNLVLLTYLLTYYFVPVFEFKNFVYVFSYSCNSDVSVAIGADSMGPAGLEPPNLRAQGPVLRLSPPPNILLYEISFLCVISTS